MSQLSRYTLLERLGNSVLGSLYKAQDTTTGSVVALRVVQLGLLDDVSSSQMDARLYRDVGVASRLLHPGIACVFEIRREGRTALIASELVEGPTITSYVAAPSGSDLSKVITVAIQLLEALEFAHAQSVIHRNLKPANVRVQGTRVRVSDFGIADLATGDVPDAGVALDNTEYMAPEQFLNGPIDHRCDVHAAGTIIYEMLTGKSPFAGDANRLTAMSKVLELVPPPPSQVRLGLPPTFDRVLERALAKSVAQRFASAREFRDELSSAYAALMRPPTTIVQSKAARSVPPGTVSVTDRTTPLPEAETLGVRLVAADATKSPEARPRSGPTTEAIPAEPAPAREVARDLPVSGGTILVKPKPSAAALATPTAEDLVRNSVPIEEVLASSTPGNEPQLKDPDVAAVDAAVDAKPESPVERPRIKEMNTIWISGKHDLSELLASVPAGSPSASAPASASAAVESPAAAAVDAQAQMRGAPPASKPVAPLTEATVTHGGRVLARFVGPIATVFSRRAAQQAQDERGYFELLARHLPDASERSRFMRELRKRPG